MNMEKQSFWDLCSPVQQRPAWKITNRPHPGKKRCWRFSIKWLKPGKIGILMNTWAFFTIVPKFSNGCIPAATMERFFLNNNTQDLREKNSASNRGFQELRLLLLVLLSFYIYIAHLINLLIYLNKIQIYFHHQVKIQQYYILLPALV